jgi:dipeptidyl aminopeptidase/acylaminoacyl peptidase
MFFRSSCFGYRSVSLFHFDQQLEQMLNDNFDGRRFAVPSFDGTAIDCMFFPHSDETVITASELQKDPSKKTPQYLTAPTVIYFNPNAQCYQQQVHTPNAFWLKFFVQKGINVLAWNYRNYARSEGTPNPYLTYHDSEAMLKFLVEKIGVTGKIGCFGRSLGGTMATHVAKNYPEFVSFLFVDRSLGNLAKMSQSSFIGKYTPSILELLAPHWVI